MTHTDLPASPPTFSAFITAAVTYESVRRTIDHLVAQTIANEIELLLVAPDASALDTMPADLADQLHSVQPIYVGPIDDVDKAMAPAIRAARGEVVAMVEDHVFLEPDWAEALLAAHRRGDWVAVGSTVENANPSSPLSWANQLMAYGEWTPPLRRGETDHVSRHNISFKRAKLEPYFHELESRLGRAGGLLQKLLKDGHTFYNEPAAKVRHINPSRLGSTVQLRCHSGRLYAASRMARENWSLGKRLVYVGGSPLIPAMRFRKVAGKVFADGRWRRRPGLLPSVLGVLALDAGGQAVGFLFGPGGSEQRLAAFEFDRHRHLTDRDRRELAI